MWDKVLIAVIAVALLTRTRADILFVFDAPVVMRQATGIQIQLMQQFGIDSNDTAVFICRRDGAYAANGVAYLQLPVPLLQKPVTQYVLADPCLDGTGSASTFCMIIIISSSSISSSLIDVIYPEEQLVHLTMSAPSHDQPNCFCAVTLPTSLGLTADAQIALYMAPTTSWGARALCAAALGGALADSRSLSQILGNFTLARALPVTSNTTFYSADTTPLEVGDVTTAGGGLNWARLSTNECCSSGLGSCPAAAVALSWITDANQVSKHGLNKVSLQVGIAPLYQPCDFAWNLQRSFACISPQYQLCHRPVPCAPLPFGSAQPSPVRGSSPGLDLYRTGASYWGAVGRCNVSRQAQRCHKGSCWMWAAGREGCPRVSQLMIIGSWLPLPASSIVHLAQSWLSAHWEAPAGGEDEELQLRKVEAMPGRCVLLCSVATISNGVLGVPRPVNCSSRHPYLCTQGKAPRHYSKGPGTTDTTDQPLCLPRTASQLHPAHSRPDSSPSPTPAAASHTYPTHPPTTTSKPTALTHASLPTTSLPSATPLTFSSTACAPTTGACASVASFATTTSAAPITSTSPAASITPTTSTASITPTTSTSSITPTTSTASITPATTTTSFSTPPQAISLPASPLSFSHATHPRPTFAPILSPVPQAPHLIRDQHGSLHGAAPVVAKDEGQGSGTGLTRTTLMAILLGVLLTALLLAALVVAVIGRRWWHKRKEAHTPSPCANGSGKDDGGLQPSSSTRLCSHQQVPSPLKDYAAAGVSWNPMYTPSRLASTAATGRRASPVHSAKRQLQLEGDAEAPDVASVGASEWALPADVHRSPQQSMRTAGLVSCADVICGDLQGSQQADGKRPSGSENEYTTPRKTLRMPASLTPGCSGLRQPREASRACSAADVEEGGGGTKERRSQQSSGKRKQRVSTISRLDRFLRYSEDSDNEDNAHGLTVAVVRLAVPSRPKADK
ncbi:hypothetical protein QJQ45_018846 [Haematococcus lacustris]|nr:hypothetical protein QJQ45_018846 [Haematococcus lacustris]